jgi:hypothetical protein
MAWLDHLKVAPTDSTPAPDIWAADSTANVWNDPAPPAPIPAPDFWTPDPSQNDATYWTTWDW